jgi:hypothetical protein
VENLDQILAGKRQARAPDVSGLGAADAAGTLPPLVETKFAQPRQRSGIVQRARILSTLDAGEGAALTLLAAPTGYGKTTAVCAHGARAGSHRSRG